MWRVWRRLVIDSCNTNLRVIARVIATWATEFKMCSAGFIEDFVDSSQIPSQKRVKHHDEFMSEMMIPLKVKKLTEHAYLPTRGSTDAAGYDLYR